VNCVKLLLTFIACLFLAGIVQAQNPYESIGRHAEMLTLSNGQYQEFIPNDTLVVIGSVLFNTMTEQIVGFAETDTVLINPGFEPEVRSRFLSVDPYAASFPNISPYAYANNDPIRFMDPTGMYPVCGDACDETYQAGNVVENRHGSWEYQGNNQWLDLNTGDTVSGSSLLARYESEYARASVAALGVFVPLSCG